MDNYFNDLKQANPHEAFKKILINQLKIFNNDAAWLNKETREWLNEPDLIDETELEKQVSEHIKLHYDNRASTLKETHPLGIQVNLVTGVANGVLVVRTTEDCAKLIKRIVTRTLEVELKENDEYTSLIEKISGCVFRVMTKDVMLTNTFWNFYLDPAE